LLSKKGDKLFFVPGAMAEKKKIKKIKKEKKKQKLEVYYEAVK